MPPSGKTWTEEQLEQMIGTLLRGGVVIAAAVVLTGAIFYLIHYGSARPSYLLFRGEPTDLRNVFGILSDALSFNRRGVIQLGLLLLIATPVARVVFSVIAFAMRGDRTYVLVTLMVLGVLIYSLFRGGL